MTSQLNVDTIVDKAGSGGTNITVGNDATYVAEGGSANSYNLVQGLAKQWSKINQDTLAITDSFNTTSLTDVSPGEYACNFTNNMSNANYANSCQKEAEAANADCTEYTTGNNATSSVRRQDVENNAGRDAARSDTITHGDLA